MFKESHFLGGRYPMCNTKRYSKVILKVKIYTEIAKDDLSNWQQIRDGNPFIADDLQL